MNEAQEISVHVNNWYSTYHLHLANIGMRLGYGREETKDAIHQFFLDLLEKKVDPASIDNPQAYLSVAFKRKLIDLHRSASRQKMINYSDLPDFQTSPSVQETIEQIQASTELIANIRKAYFNLPARCRNVIYLKFFEGLTTEQIAERTGLSKRSVYNNLFEGVKLLRADLQAVSPKMEFGVIISLLGLCLVNGIV
ncbi:sigma-70 family RNA polymerase sigma factor [Danxiaibacter flavus]|uniref:Sigma-70 family RNA polymerase sigma factor n=1 Tax=Danxiaibacter flavus TaxID=3049108 RepID=A0ABV3ZFZ2_9BACT|nr:sigma-70 family RNA polymerase sigma factor [Chitinophagaceae bacterium DXS]